MYHKLLTRLSLNDCKALHYLPNDQYQFLIIGTKLSLDCDVVTDRAVMSFDLYAVD